MRAAVTVTQAAVRDADTDKQTTVVTSTSSRKHQRDSGCSIQHDAARKGGERRCGEADGDSMHQFTAKGASRRDRWAVARVEFAYGSQQACGRALRQ